MSNLPLPRERNLFFASQVNQDTVNKLTQDILNINENDELLKKTYGLYGLTYNPHPIKIYIDSYGGSAYQIFGLASIMESSCTPIHTIATGAAMSAGFLMLICGHKRFAHKHATIMYHQVASTAYGKLEDMKENLAETKRLQKVMESIVLDKTKITKKKIKEINTAKFDWFMNPSEALVFNVIDEIIN